MFSAVLTAFNVQSYQLLQPAPTDSATFLLQQISTQLNSFSINPPFINATLTSPAPPLLPRPFQAPSSAVWINTLWFSSLVCSLASASLALIVKQWLHQAVMGLSGTSRESARFRQHRLDGLLKWRVGSIVTALPILLQVALIFFLVGMVMLLWTLHPTVAIVVSSLVATLFAVFVVVTFLPVFKWDCCYRSPQAFAVYAVIRLIYNAIKRLLGRVFKLLWDWRIRREGRIESKSLASRMFFWNLRDFAIPTWHGRDEQAIALSAGQLDRRIITSAYATTLSPSYLRYLHVVFSDLPGEHINACLQDIWSVCDSHWKAPTGGELQCHWLKHILKAEPSALYAVRHMLTIPECDRDEGWRRDTLDLLAKLVSISGPQDCGSELVVSTLAPLCLGNNDLAWTASSALGGYWTVSSVPNEEVASYAVLRSGTSTGSPETTKLTTTISSSCVRMETSELEA